MVMNIRLSALVLGLATAALCEGAVAAPAAEAAKTELDAAMQLTPNLDDGRNIYLTCAVCHRPEGWGTADGTYPQIAGQLRPVIVKQLADIRTRNREAPLMHPFVEPRILGGPQEIADVAAYVARLPMTPHNGTGQGTDLALGERLYQQTCATCHGEHGEGDADQLVPAIAGQHYNYLMRQFDEIRSGRRKSSHPGMVAQIEDFSPEQQAAVLDYSSRLRPPAAKVAKEGWRNPDFPNYVRPPAATPAADPEAGPSPP
jgi:cytochrome c553